MALLVRPYLSFMWVEGRISRGNKNANRYLNIDFKLAKKLVTCNFFVFFIVQDNHLNTRRAMLYVDCLTMQTLSRAPPTQSVNMWKTSFCATNFKRIMRALYNMLRGSNKYSRRKEGLAARYVMMMYYLVLLCPLWADCIWHCLIKFSLTLTCFACQA